MRSVFYSLLAGALLMGGTAQAQAPAAEVQALSRQLNDLVRVPKSESEPDAEIVVSLANCGFKQTFRKYRTKDKSNATVINVSSSKNGASWGVKTDEKVELEFSQGLDWAEVGSIGYLLKTDDKTNRPHYSLVVKRREAAGKSSSSTITLSLNTQDEKQVAQLVQRLQAVKQHCTGAKS